MISESFDSSETVADETSVEVVEDVDAVEVVDDGAGDVADDSDEESVLVLEEASLPEAVLPVWEPTGNAAVDSALEDLHALADTDVNEHAAVYEKVQASLRATLDGLVSEDESA